LWCAEAVRGPAGRDIGLSSDFIDKVTQETSAGRVYLCASHLFWRDAVAHLMYSLVCFADGFVECRTLEEFLDEKSLEDGNPRPPFMMVAMGGWISTGLMDLLFHACYASRSKQNVFGSVSWSG